MINTWILLVALVALTGLRVVSGAERHEAVASSEGQLWLGPDEIVMAYDEVFLWNIGSVVEAYGEISLWLGPDEIVMAYGEGSLWLGPDEIEMAYGEAQLSLQEKEPDYIIKGFADPADGGKVTGGGFCAEGKRVTLKATANKGFVFIGWKKDDGEEGDALKAATLVFDRTVKPAQSNAKQCVITEFTGDEIWCARFVTSEFDKENIAAAVDGLSLEPWVSKDETHAAVTNI